MFSMKMNLPNSNICIHPGDKIKLARFDSTVWIVNYGWFSFDYNRDICGWYLTDIETGEIKPIFKTDLHDCYSVQ